ncbi:MAG: hypothetical protein ACK560_06520 [Bacteroidota bacterium]|jgi:hypothetical protein
MSNKSLMTLLAFLVLMWAQSTASAQSDSKKPGNKQHPTTVTEGTQVQIPETGPNAKLDKKLASQKRGAVASNSHASGARSCTPLKRENPYSISRADFQNLPADRQRFILENKSKYTIID